MTQRTRRTRRSRRNPGLPPRHAVASSVAAALLTLVPTPAQAHLVGTGLGPLYDGISQVFVHLEDLLGVVALALVAGLNGPGAGRQALWAAPAACFLGSAIGHSAAAPLLPGVVTGCSLLVLGALTAMDTSLPAWGVGGLATAFGLLHGWGSAAALARGAQAPLSLLGMATGVFVLVALLAALVVSLRTPWTRIAVRVAGSWVAAVGLLLLGWAFRAR